MTGAQGAVHGATYTIYTSPDGVHFVEETVSGPVQDRSSIYYDGLRGKWVYSIKGNAMDPAVGGYDRMRKYVEGTDIVADAHWSKKG